MVLAHRKPQQLAGLVASLRDDRIRTYLHVDSRVQLDPFARAIEESGTSNVALVPRHPTPWGSAGLVDAGLEGLRHRVDDGVTIGTGAVVGAGSVVSRDLPAYAVAVGTPAAPVRFRFDERVIERLLASEWWTWSFEEIRSKAPLFTEPLTEALLDRYLPDAQ